MAPPYSLLMAYSQLLAPIFTSVLKVCYAGEKVPSQGVLSCAELFATALQKAQQSQALQEERLTLPWWQARDCPGERNHGR